MTSWTRTQPASSTAFTQQLDCGARAFDLRAHVNWKGELLFHHGNIQVGHPAEQVLAEVAAWANAHPSMEDLVVIYTWDCTGKNCSEKMSQALAKAGMGVLRDSGSCDTVANLTVGTAAARSSLNGGGNVLILQGEGFSGGGPVKGCIDQNYDPSVTCSGFNGPWNHGRTLPDNCLNLPANSTSDEKYACGLKLRESLKGSAEQSILGYYRCWSDSSGRNFAMDRMVQSLVEVAAKPPPRGRLQEMQALWQESPSSIIIGVAHGSSLLMDEEKSGLNALMVEKINADTFKHISLFEVNNVCNHGPELLQALRGHHSRKMLVNQRSFVQTGPLVVV